MRVAAAADKLNFLTKHNFKYGDVVVQQIYCNRHSVRRFPSHQSITSTLMILRYLDFYWFSVVSNQLYAEPNLFSYYQKNVVFRLLQIQYRVPKCLCSNFFSSGLLIMTKKNIQNFANLQRYLYFLALFKRKGVVKYKKHKL